MPVRCCVCGASNQIASLFEFPKNEPLRTIWKEFANISEIRSSKLCHRHFVEEEMYSIEAQNTNAENGEKRKFKRRLKANAVPSIKIDENLCDIRDVKLSKKYFCLQCKIADNIIHFKFPTNLEKRNEWLKRCGYGPDFFNGDKFWYLCVRHFPDNAILRKERAGGATRLRADAVPTMFMAEQQWSSDLNKNTSTDEPITDHVLPPRKMVLDADESCHPSINDLNVDRADWFSDGSPNELQASKLPQSLKSETACNTMRNGEVAMYCTTSVHDYTSPTVVSKILALSSHNDCVQCVAFKRHIQTSLKDVSPPPQVTPTPRGGAAKRSLRYPGDISSPDYATPNRARRSVRFLKDEVEKQRKKVHVLQKQNKYLKERIKKYDDLMSHLKEKDLISDSAYATLSVSFNFEKDEFHHF